MLSKLKDHEKSAVLKEYYIHSLKINILIMHYEISLECYKKLNLGKASDIFENSRMLSDIVSIFSFLYIWLHEQVGKIPIKSPFIPVAHFLSDIMTEGAWSLIKDMP